LIGDLLTTEKKGIGIPWDLRWKKNGRVRCGGFGGFVGGGGGGGGLWKASVLKVRDLLVRREGACRHCSFPRMLPTLVPASVAELRSR